MLKGILKSIGILFLISFSVSFIFYKDYISFLKLFLLTLILQIICYNIYKKIVEISLEKIKNERIKEYSKQGMDIKCPCYLEKVMFVPIELNKENSFKCLECNKDVSVEVSARCFMKTDVIDLDNAEAAIAEAYKKIKI
jgi:hypothetical protein